MILNLLLDESKKNLKLQEMLKNEIDKLPKGSVKKRIIKGRAYYYLAYRENKKVINRYIGSNAVETLSIMNEVEKRKTYEKKLKDLKNDWVYFNKAGIYENTGEISCVIDSLRRGKDFKDALKDFLHIFYSNRLDKEKLKFSITKEPRRYKKVPAYQYALCAATVHKLANEYSLEIPEWVWDKRYYLKEMYIDNEKNIRLRAMNIIHSPEEFKRRNLFVDRDYLKV